MYHKRGLWAIKAKNGGVFPRHDAKSKVDSPAEKPPKFYPAEDVKKPLANRRKPKPTKLRSSITPGTVLIILAGRFKGKRVVFMKQLTSGLLLVSGPFKINGVPLRRVKQSYVIGTSTKVDISGVGIHKLDDKYFGKVAEKKNKKAEGEFLEAEKEEKKEIPQGKKDDQKAVDAALIKAIEAVPELKTYLGARDESRTILRLKRKFPPYYIEALCNVFGSDEKKVKESFEEAPQQLNLHKRNHLGGLVGKNKSYVEVCIRRNVALSLSPSPSINPNTSHFDVMRDQLCRDETRVIMYFLEMNGKFPTYYVEVLCNVFGDNEKKVKAYVKAYVIRKWLDHSKKLVDSLTCASP
ncbi:unnamed protein product [Brassica oleracea]|uniref:(rape) hypothetical protein n=1 Tax=Brassica napus TaxID=3708 RepID=A0A816QFU2_BRANA|nr:unnamed protein product [Brassica napus]